MGPKNAQKQHLPRCDGERQAVCTGLCCVPTAVLGRLDWSHCSHPSPSLQSSTASELTASTWVRCQPDRAKDTAFDHG